MGLLKDKLTNSNNDSSPESLPSAEFRQEEVDDGVPSGVNFRVYQANLQKQTDLLEIKDKLFEGNMVFVNVNNLEGTGIDLEKAQYDLKQVAKELGGDIAKTNSGFIVITPGGVDISRTKLGS